METPAVAPKKIPTSLPRRFLEEPCPCGSTRLLKSCCFAASDGQLRLPLPELRPPAPVTGYAHPKCYMAATEDCSAKISGEHYISKSVLSALGDTIVCSGMPWQRKGESATYGKNSLTANVLCQRHNTALSPIDLAAERFFRDLTQIAIQLGRKAWSKRISVHAVRGELIEFWALKTLMGIYHAGIARQGSLRLRDHFPMPLERYCAALSGDRFVIPLGMYLFTAINHGLRVSKSVSVAPLTALANDQVAGLWMVVAGFDMKFMFDLGTINFNELRKNHTHRPTDLVFVSSHSVDERVFILKLSWGSAAPATVTFTLGDAAT